MWQFISVAGAVMFLKIGLHHRVIVTVVPAYCISQGGQHIFSSRGIIRTGAMSRTTCRMSFPNTLIGDCNSRGCYDTFSTFLPIGASASNLSLNSITPVGSTKESLEIADPEVCLRIIHRMIGKTGCRAFLSNDVI